jgi:large subunit ribosomal protein L13e
MHHIKPTVQRTTGKMKQGKGFSPKELAEAGVTRFQARELGLPVDNRRRTTHKDNVDAVKAHAKAVVKPATVKKPKESKSQAKS